MNILILNDSGFGLEGGRGIYGKEVYCEVLAKLNARLGNRVLKVALGRGNNLNADVVPLEGSNIPAVRTFYDNDFSDGLMKLCRKFEIDLIHANILNARYPIVLSRTVNKLKLPLVITVHSWAYLCPTNYNVMLPGLIPCEISSINPHCIECMISKAKLMSFSPLLSSGRMLHQTFALNSLLKDADSIISPSEAFAERLSKRRDNMIYHIPNPVNPQLLEEEPTFGGDGSILFMGRIEYEKGVHLLPPLAKILSDVKIHIIGRGSLEWLFHQNRLPNIFYHGFVTEREKLGFIRRATAVIVPSIWHEMFGGVASEAFSLGKPVVAFDIGGPKEQITASDGGLLAKPFELKDYTEKVKYLIENPSEANRMGLNGRNWVKEKLNLERYAEELVKVYEQACASS